MGGQAGQPPGGGLLRQPGQLLAAVHARFPLRAGGGERGLLAAEHLPVPGHAGRAHRRGQPGADLIPAGQRDHRGQPGPGPPGVELPLCGRRRRHGDPRQLPVAAGGYPVRGGDHGPAGGKLLRLLLPGGDGLGGDGPGPPGLAQRPDRRPAGAGGRGHPPVPGHGAGIGLHPVLPGQVDR